MNKIIYEEKTEKGSYSPHHPCLILNQKQLTSILTKFLTKFRDQESTDF